MSDNLIDFLVGLNIKKVRRSKKITQGDIAEVLQLSRTSIFASPSDFGALSREMNKAADKVKLFGMEVRSSPS